MSTMLKCNQALLVWFLSYDHIIIRFQPDVNHRHLLFAGNADDDLAKRLCHFSHFQTDKHSQWLTIGNKHKYWLYWAAYIHSFIPSLLEEFHNTASKPHLRARQEILGPYKKHFSLRYIIIITVRSITALISQHANTPTRKTSTAQMNYGSWKHLQWILYLIRTR